MTQGSLPFIVDRFGVIKKDTSDAEDEYSCAMEFEIFEFPVLNLISGTHTAHEVRAKAGAEIVALQATELNCKWPYRLRVRTKGLEQPLWAVNCAAPQQDFMYVFQWRVYLYFKCELSYVKNKKGSNYFKNIIPFHMYRRTCAKYKCVFMFKRLRTMYLKQPYVS
jgi:hypothetical protein